MKRKRRSRYVTVETSDTVINGRRKRQKLLASTGTRLEQYPSNPIHHPVLSAYYPRIYRLRDWLLQRLKEHKASYKRISHVRNVPDDDQLLDRVLVGVLDGKDKPSLVLAQAQGYAGSSHIVEYGQEASQALGTARGRVVASATPTAKGGGGRIPAQAEV